MPAANADTERVTLVNRTSSNALLTASSGSGGASIEIPAGGARTARWPRTDTGPDQIRSKVRVPGKPDLTRSSSIPVR